MTTKDPQNAPSMEVDGKLKVLRFKHNIKLLNNPISLSQLKYVVKNSEDFDILHFNDIYAFSTYSALFVKKPKKVVSFHTWLIKYENRLKDSFTRTFEKFAFKRIISRMDALIVLVNTQKDYLKKMGIDQNKIFIVPNGVQTDFFGRDKDEAKNYFNIETDFAIGFFARFVERKGIHVLLDAFKNLKNDLYIFGYGPLKPLILEYSKKYPHIHLIEGPFSEEEVALIYSAMDLYLLPSLSGEGCPTGLLEALASGTLCLASDLPENICTLKDKGIYCRVGDSKDLQEKIRVAKSVAIDKADLKHYATEYDWRNISRKITDVYDEILGNIP
jgi:glycosyltransferase involved in cell wall biosynthesis